MGELKRRKYLGILGILLLVVGIIFLFSYGKIDKYRGLVKVKNVEVNKKILSSVANTEAMTSNGTDEIDYEIKYTLDRIDGIETRNAVIEASLNSEYAEFKEINGNNIESTVSNEGKKIEVRINNVRLGEEQTLNLIIIVRNAPNNEEISPVIRIKETTGDYTEVIGEKVTVHTGSILGVVYDENRLPVGNIELSINRNGREIRRTYTREDGVFNFSDLDDGEYLIKVEEDNYEIESGSNKRISDNLQEIKVKTVDKFDIETHKYVERLKLIVDGQEKTYTYKDKEKVVEALKNAKEVSGEIEYKIVVKNRGEKDTAIERVIDERGEGLKFKQEKNAGWEEDDEKIYYRPLEGVSLSSGETREVRLILDIEKTKEIKTYINKLTTKGQIKEKVIYILNGRKIKEESVIEGDKVSRPSIEVEGWYTDKNFTNKYNFNREVNKDLILYAKTEELKHIVTFVDKDPDTEAENIIEQVEVRDKEKVSEKPGPSKIGYNFVCWRNEYGICYNFNDKVERNITLTSSYEPIVYTIEYEGITSEERTSLNNPTSYTVRSNIVLNNPNNRKDEHGFDREIFVGWKEREADTPSTDIRLPDRNSLGNKKYTAIFERIEDDEYPITYILNGGTVSGNPNVYKKTDTFTLNNPTKEGYTFTGWTGSNGDTQELTVTVPIGTTGPLSFEAHYSPVIYNITYNLDGGSLEQGVTNPDTYTIETPTFTINNPSKTGYDFIGWSGTEIEGKSTEVIISQGSKGDRTYTANYKKKKYTVTYMDGENLQGTEEVEYNEKALGNVERPSKAHNIFIGWTLNNELYNFDTPVTEDITLYSSYELVEPPVITHRPTEWTRENVIVNITSNHNDYSYKYRVLDGENINYAGEFVIEENTDIYGYSEKNGVVSEEVKHEIRNIDRINPRINSITNTVSATSATLTIKGQDLESGIGFIKVYKENELVFSTEEYPGNNNEEQTETVTIGNLTELSSYTFKVEIIDKVGNSTTQDITIETIDKHYVARTYEDDGTEIKKYETLREAIESPECVSRCNIQMLDNVTEANVILDGQEIKLDLNGLTITGIQDKAFENNGVFQVVDYNEDAVGKIYSEGTGIINNNELTVGENEVELIVSKTEPIIEGTINGIYTPGRFNFYDGQIIGSGTSGALKGTSPHTPFSYNASVETSGGKEIATLEIIADAEARINSVYYTKLQQAIDDSKNGKYETDAGSSEIMSQIKSKSDYIFVYDEGTGTLKSNNQGVANSFAESYIYFDLRKNTSDKILNIVSSISSQSGADIGYVTVTDNNEPVLYNQEDGRIIYVSGETKDQVNYILEKGKEHYLHIGYRKDGGTNSAEDTFTINNISLSDYTLNDESGELLNHLVSNNDKHFIKQEDNSYQNNFIGSYNRTVDSYIKIDMTGIDEEKVLYADISGRTPTAWYSVSYDYITLTNSEDTPSYDQTEGRIFYANGDISRRKVEIHLLPNQENYIHFCQYNGGTLHDSNTVFNLYSLKLEDEIVKERLESDIVKADTYYMYESTIEERKWKDLSGNGYDGIVVGATLNDTQDGYVFNGSSYVYVPNNQISIDTEESVEVKFSTTSTAARSVLYTGNNNEKITISIYDGYLIVTTRNTYNTFNLPENYNNGEINSFIVTYDNGDYKAYFNNSELEKRTNNDWWSSDTNSYIGCRSGGYYFDGTIYQVKVFDRVLTDEEITNNTIGDENLQLYLDASDSIIVRDKPIFINNNQGVPNSVATSYMTFDLTDVSSYKTIYVNCEISSYYNTWPGNGDWGFVSVTGSEVAPAYNDTSNRYVAIMGEEEAREYPVTLTPGRVNYVHFGYRKDPHASSGRDTFQINYIRYYEDSNNTIPKYIFSGATTKKENTPHIVLNEEPDTVQIIRNITVTNPVEIVETRDVILDLNGFTLTTSKEDYVVKNNGSLKIIDSQYEDPSTDVLTGNITSTTSSVVLNDYNSYLNVEEGILNLEKPGSLDIITNRGTLTLGENAYLNGKQTSNRGINNTTRGDVLEGSGNINMIGSGNIAFLNQSMVDDNISGYNLNVTSSNSINIYNNAQIPTTFENIKTSGAGIDVYQNVNNNLNIRDSILGSTSNNSYSSNASSVVSTVTFDNCDIKNRIYNDRDSYRKIIINDSTLSGSNENIYNFHGEVEVNNSELTSSSRNINQVYGLITINNSTVTSTYRNYENSYDWNAGGNTIINDSTFTSGDYNIYSVHGNIQVNNSEFNAPSTSIYSGYFNGRVPYGGTINLKDTNINKTGTGNTNVVYNYVGNINIDGGSINTVSDNSTAIYAERFAETNVVGDFSTSENFGRGIVNYGKLTIGNNEDSVSKTYPLIRSTNSSIYTGEASEFKYYDGKLIGIKDNTIDGHINDIPNLHDINVTKGDELDTIVLDTDADRHENNDYVAQIGSTKYVSIQEAVDSITDNTETEIVLLKNIETYLDVVIPENRNIKLNYNGNSIKVYNLDNYFVNNGTLTFIDNSNTDVVNNKFYTKKFIINNGTINYNKIKTESLRSGLAITNNENATFNINTGEIYSYETGLIDNSGMMNMTGGKIYATRTNVNNAGSYVLIENNETGELHVTGGEIVFLGTGSVIHNKNIVNIEDIKVNLRGSSNSYLTLFINAEENSVTNVTGGTYGDLNSYGKFIENKGTALVENITSNFMSVAYNSGYMKLKNNNFQNLRIYSSSTYTGHINNTGKMDVEGGVYKGIADAWSFVTNSGDRDSEKGIANIKDVEFANYNVGNSYYGYPTILSSGNSYTVVDNCSITSTGFRWASANILIEGSSNAKISNTAMLQDASDNRMITPSSVYFTGTGEVLLENNTATAYRDSIAKTGTGTLNIVGGTYTSNANKGLNNSGTGIINIGTKGDGVPSKEYPAITGNTHGIYNSNDSSTVNFYDGIITGETSITGVIAEIEPGYDIILETDTGKEVKYLDKLPVYMNIDKDTDNTYDLLQDAINDASNGDTIKLLRELTTLNTLETATNSKTLTLDLNGKKIIQNNETFISNEGNLTIVDSTATLDENGIYKGTGGIESNGITIINNSGSLTVNSGNLYTKTTTAINNSGTLEVNNGNIYMTASTGGATSDLIINSSTGTVNINNGYFKATSASSAKGSIINNEGTATINDGMYEIIGHSGGSAFIIYNASETAIGNILGGTYPKNTNIDYCNLMYNNGIGQIKDVTVHYSSVVSNQATGVLTMDNVKNLHTDCNNLLLENAIYSVGNLDIDNFELTTSCQNYQNVINIQGGDAVFKNSILNVKDSRFKFGNTSNVTFDNSTITTTADTFITLTDSSSLNIKETDISSSATSTYSERSSFIVDNSSGLLNIESGNISTPNINTMIWFEGGGRNITIGKKDGTVTESPVIRSRLYPIYQSTEDPSVLINLKMYDGKLISQNYLVGNIVETEDDNYILRDEEDNLKIMYVGNEYAFKNKRTGDKYYILKEAFDNASNNDEIQVLRNVVLTAEEDTINIPSGMKLSLDINNYSIKFNVKDCIVNDGELEIKDTSEDKKGIIECHNSKLLTNTGIFTLTDATIRSYKIYTDTITNTGTINNNGSIIVYRSETDMSGGKDTSIMNDGTFNSSGILSNTSGHCGYLEWYGVGPTYLIRNRSGATLNITGGEVTYYAQGSAIYNHGDLSITGGDFSNSSCNNYTSSVIRNAGTANVTGGTFGTSENKMKKTLFNNENAMTADGITIYAGQYSISNSSNLVLNDVTAYFEGGNIYSANGSLTLTGGNYTGSSHGFIDLRNNNTIIDNVTMTNTTGLMLDLSGPTSITNSTLTSEATAIQARGGSIVDIRNTSITSTNSNSVYVNGGTVNIIDLDPYSIKSLTSNGLYVDSGQVNIGTSGGTPSTTNPTIYGKTYGLYNASTSSIVNFYDGVIKGETGSVYGTITETEAGYKEKRDSVTDPDSGVTTIDSTLTVVGETERVAVVNNINFLSLQSAVNYASNNGIEAIQMHKSITLEDNIVLPEGGSNVKIYLGSYTINKGDYSLGTGIEEVNGTAPGASLSRFLASITGTEINPKDIVIFEMSDGSKLDSTVTYKLYKLTDNGYKIVKVNENLIGDYDLGSEKEEMNVTRGKLYIYGIGEGTYKIVGTDTKEITFEINADDVSNNIRINNAVKANRSVSVIATVILQLQTGVARSPYILVIMVLIIVILSFIAYKKHKESYEE